MFRWWHTVHHHLGKITFPDTRSGQELDTYLDTRPGQELDTEPDTALAAACLAGGGGGGHGSRPGVRCSVSRSGARDQRESAAARVTRHTRDTQGSPD